MNSTERHILIYDYKHYGVLDIREAFEKKGFQIDIFSRPLKDNLKDSEFEQALEQALSVCLPKFMFSFNFYPVISNICKKKEFLMFAGYMTVRWYRCIPIRSLMIIIIFFSLTVSSTTICGERGYLRFIICRWL